MLIKEKNCVRLVTNLVLIVVSRSVSFIVVWSFNFTPLKMDDTIESSNSVDEQ